VPNAGTARVVIKVKNRANKLVKTLKLGAKPVNTATALVAKFKVPLTWKPGTYRFFVYETDRARKTGFGGNLLVVK
jgi:hypothetical protein